MSHKTAHEKYMQAQITAEAPGHADDALDVSTTHAEHTLPENLHALCHEHICPVCTIHTDAEQMRIRALAEMENFKKRLTREHDEQLRYAAERVLADILPTLDNLDLALQYGTSHDACKDMLMGVEMTRKLLLEAVHQHGLKTVGEQGEDFTPELHEALAFDERDDMEDGKVSAVLQRGYMLKDRLLRPAKVSISRKSSE